jgi:hypothetical protein
MYALASRLNKTLGEIGNMTQDEFFGWIAYYKISEGKNVNTNNNPGN